MKLKLGDVYGMLNHLPLLNVTSRGVDRQLDNIEQVLHSAVREGEVPISEMESDTEIEEDSVRLFSESEFDALVEGVSLARATRKRLEYLMVKKEG